MNKQKIISIIVISLILLFSIAFLVISLTVYLRDKPVSEKTPETSVTEDNETDQTEPNLLTKPIINIETSNITYNSFDYIIVMNDEDNCGKILNYKICNNENVVFNFNNYTINKTFNNSINNLLGNQKYDIIVNYQFDINDGNGLTKEQKTFSLNTLSYNEPTITINQLELNSSQFAFNLKINDESDSVNLTKCYLLLNDQLISELNIEELSNEKITINNLESNNNYKLYIEYTFDLHDGKGKISKKILKEFTTSLKEQEELIPETPESDVTLTVEDIVIPSKGYTLVTPIYSIENENVKLKYQIPSKSSGVRAVIIYDPTDASSKLLFRYMALYGMQNSNVSVYVVDLTSVLSDSEISNNETLVTSTKKYSSTNNITVDRVTVLSNISIPISTTYDEFVAYLESYTKQ